MGDVKGACTVHGGRRPPPELQGHLGRGQPGLNRTCPGSRRGHLRFLGKARRTPARQPREPHKMLSNDNQEVFLRVHLRLLSGIYREGSLLFPPSCFFTLTGNLLLQRDTAV